MSDATPEVELGEKYRDTVTGFMGIATAKFIFLNGCVRYQLDAPKKDGDGIQELVFDEQRLEHVGQEAVPFKARRTGGPQGSSAPRRTGATR